MDKPNDQSSRWSSESNYPPQVGSFLMSFNFVDLEQQLSMKVVICVGS